MKKFRMMATAAFGIEAVVGKELRQLGMENVKVEDGRIFFEGTMKDLAIANMWSRTADRIYVVLSQFKAYSFEELFQGISKIPWEEYISVDDEFPVNAKSVKSKVYSKADIQRISKKSIVKRLNSVYGVDWFKETGDKYSIWVNFLRDEVTVCIDSSGIGLHKRGYREIGNEAPLKETLAAALVSVSNWHDKIPLMDPMCGTGTILIEAAMKALNIAPGIQRTFACENWSWIDQEVFKEVRAEARLAIDFDKELTIIGSDLNRRTIEIARKNAEKAMVEEYIRFEVRDALSLKTPIEYGYMISNPPYGERIGEEESIFRLYQQWFKVIDNDFSTWSYYILTSHERLEEAFRKKATKNRKLYNGKLKCYFYQYYGPKPPRNKDKDHAKEKEQ